MEVEDVTFAHGTLSVKSDVVVDGIELPAYGTFYARRLEMSLELFMDLEIDHAREDVLTALCERHYMNKSRAIRWVSPTRIYLTECIFSLN